MNQKVSELREKFETELQSVKDVTELENMRVAYLGKKGSITAVLKDMGKLSDEERKALGQEVNVLKNEVTDRIADKKEEFARLELENEINSCSKEFFYAIKILTRSLSIGDFTCYDKYVRNNENKIWLYLSNDK